MRRGLAWLRAQVDRAARCVSSTPHDPVDTLPSDGGIPSPFKSDAAHLWPEYMDDDPPPLWLREAELAYIDETDPIGRRAREVSDLRAYRAQKASYDHQRS